ncbi:MAG TPA: hypothetical protein VKG25_02980 [Bryobacteraceae bacterium]|nr:hypothetical protein [Bryobacteraceae bacterium]
MRLVIPGLCRCELSQIGEPRGGGSCGGMSKTCTEPSLDATSSEEAPGLKIAVIISAPVRNGRVSGSPVCASKTRAV